MTTFRFHEEKLDLEILFELIADGKLELSTSIDYDKFVGTLEDEFLRGMSLENFAELHSFYSPTVEQLDNDAIYIKYVISFKNLELSTVLEKVKVSEVEDLRLRCASMQKKINFLETELSNIKNERPQHTMTFTYTLNEGITIQYSDDVLEAYFEELFNVAFIKNFYTEDGTQYNWRRDYNSIKDLLADENRLLNWTLLDPKTQQSIGSNKNIMQSINSFLRDIPYCNLYDLFCMYADGLSVDYVNYALRYINIFKNACADNKLSSMVIQEVHFQSLPSYELYYDLKTLKDMSYKNNWKVLIENSSSDADYTVGFRYAIHKCEYDHNTKKTTNLYLVWNIESQ